MKKIKYLIALLTTVVLFCVASNTKVNATYQEEVEQIDRNESKLSKLFDKEVTGYVCQFFVGLGYVVAGMKLCSKPLKKVKESFDRSTAKNKATQEEISNTKIEIAKNNEITQKNIEENNKATQKAIQEDNAKTRAQLETIKEVVILAFTNDDKLVKKGIAEQIVNKLGSDTNEKPN